MKELINLTKDQRINAEDLWRLLNRPQGDFNHWINRYLLNEDYGQLEPEDFTTNMSVSNDGRPKKIYYLSIDCSKTLSMLLNNDTGRKVRKYFIDVEKRFKQIKTLTRLELIDMMRDTEVERLRLEKENQTLLPKAEFADAVADSSESVSVGIFAKAIGTGQNRLFAFLKDNKYLMENNEPYQKYLDLDIFKVIEQTYKKHSKTMITFKTLITGKGQKYLCKKLSEVYKP